MDEKLEQIRDIVNLLIGVAMEKELDSVGRWQMAQFIKILNIIGGRNNDK